MLVAITIIGVLSVINFALVFFNIRALVAIVLKTNDVVHIQNELINNVSDLCEQTLSIAKAVKEMQNENTPA